MGIFLRFLQQTLFPSLICEIEPVISLIYQTCKGQTLQRIKEYKIRSPSLHITKISNSNFNYF